MDIPGTPEIFLQLISPPPIPGKPDTENEKWPGIQKAEGQESPIIPNIRKKKPCSKPPTRFLLSDLPSSKLT